MWVLPSMMRRPRPKRCAKRLNDSVAAASLTSRVLTGRDTAAGEVERTGDAAAFTSRAGTVRGYPGSGWRLRFPAPVTRRCELVLTLTVDGPEGLHLEGLRSHRLTL